MCWPGRIKSSDDIFNFRLPIFDLGESNMTQIFQANLLSFRSDNPKSSQRYLKFFLRLIMGDRSDDVEGHTRTRERMAHGNVYAPVRRPDRVCVSLFRPYRD